MKHKKAASSKKWVSSIKSKSNKNKEYGRQGGCPLRGMSAIKLNIKDFEAANLSGANFWMKPKKAIELSINFMVILIMSIVLFGFGIKFINDISKSSQDITKISLDELDNRISDLACQGSDRVCVPNERIKIKKKELGVFGVRILNILDPPLDSKGQKFSIEFKPPSDPDPIGYKKDNTPILKSTTIPALIIKKRDSVFIKKNEEHKLGIGIDVPKNAVSGTYVFNLDVTTSIGGIDDKYAETINLYVEVS